MPDKAEPIILDDANEHASSRLWPVELLPQRAAIPMALYFTWVINAGLASEDVYTLPVVDQYQLFLQTPFDVIDYFDRKLTTEMMSPQCAAFSRLYYLADSRHPFNYQQDLQELIVPHMPSIYHMDQTINNLIKVSAIVQTRYTAWVGHDPDFTQ